MKIVRKLFKLIFVLALIAAVIVAASVYWEIFQWKSKSAAEVAISKGSHLNAVAAQLERGGVIRSPKIFSFYARLKGVSGKLHAGEYEFPAGISIDDVLNAIVEGEVKRYRFTVIEGWNLKDIEKMLSEMEFLGPKIAEEFSKLIYDTNYHESLGVGGVLSLEGYLFPDTYVIDRPKGAKEIIEPMVKQYKGVYTDAFRKRAKELGMTDREVLILASIIEKETGKGEERPIISSVFHNRLKKGMVLASDPTVIYGIKDFDGNLRRRDLERPGPYNTYLTAGLTPGPICNPGKDSIEAALYPAKTDYFFFVSKNDGSHHFSKTMGEHSRAVIHYQKRRSDEPFK
jgi:UPF0755 protein